MSISDTDKVLMSKLMYKLTRVCKELLNSDRCLSLNAEIDSVTSCKVVSPNFL